MEQGQRESRIDVSMKDVCKQMTMNVRIRLKGIKPWCLRCKIATGLIRLAAWLMYFKSNIIFSKPDEDIVIGADI